MQAQEIHKRTLKLMGSRFEITVTAENPEKANQYIDTAVGEIQRIERLISSWDPASQTSEINRNAGIKPVVVDPELYNLISRALKISEITDGAFDISYASMDKIWKFDGSMSSMPSEDAIRNSVSKVRYQNIILHPEDHSVFLKKEGMKIGFGAIGKGYAADRAKDLLRSQGITAGIINASGDMNTWGTQPNGDTWKVAITNPLNKEHAFALLPLENRAVVTSGDYEKFVKFNGVRYSHIINPKTGYPATGIISATVFAPKAELADALATSVFVMGIETGIDRINQLPGIDCIIVDTNGKVHTSKNIKLDSL
ncbi:MAG: FAD:protein FMN transferase [Christiangramia sp.]|uniref:FAD:protein FMN transferase n=1 Tax=Christiangramia sp. TaxID=1931228 RepID=UPI0032428EC3